MDKQTKSKFDRTTLFFSCDSMPGTIINQQIHTYLHAPVLLLSQVPIVSSMIPYHPITTLEADRIIIYLHWQKCVWHQEVSCPHNRSSKTEAIGDRFGVLSGLYSSADYGAAPSMDLSVVTYSVC